MSAFLEIMQSSSLHLPSTKINLSFPKFPDKLILWESKQLFYQIHSVKLGLSVQFRTLS